MPFRSVLALVSAAVLVVACRPTGDAAAASQTPTAIESTGEVDALATAILDEYFATWPVAATTTGEHRHDHRWPDLSPAGLQRDWQRIEAAARRVDAAIPGASGADERVDLDIVRTDLALQRFGHEVTQAWSRDPMWYAQLLGSGLDDLVSRDFGPLATRAQSVASRLEGVPALVEQAIHNLDAGQPMKPHTVVAVDQLQGVLTLIGEVIPSRTEGAPAATRRRIAAATPAAIEAVKRLRTFVETTLRPRATDSWRLGAEAFGRKLPLTLHTDLTATQVHRRARAEHARVRAQMDELSSTLAPVLLDAKTMTEIDALAKADPKTASRTQIAAVLDALATDHVKPEQLRDTIETALDRLGSFVAAKGIVPMDDAEVLEVIWTPAHQRGVYIAGLAAPGPLETQRAGLPSFYLVQPVPPDWTAEVQESFLREYNNFMLEILSIHEAIPGHFVQLYYAKRESSVARRVLQNGPFVEGWAVYAEKVMVDAGYAGQGPPPGAARPRSIPPGLWKVMTDDELRASAIALHGLKFYLRTVTNAILDYEIHAQGLSEADALRMMIEEAFQGEGEAQGKWIRAQVTSTQLSTYFVGAQAWWTLRTEAQQRAEHSGKPFDLRRFHAAALSHGAPPVHRLPELLGWTPPPSR